MEAVAASTGEPLTKARAAALWVDLSLIESSPFYVKSQFDSKAIEVGEGGVFRLPCPTGEEPTSGLIIVKAKGFAAKTIPDVTWLSSKPIHLRTRLEPEAIVKGVVVDSDREPVEGAFLVIAMDLKKIESFAVYTSLINAKLGGRRTDAKGGFRIDGPRRELISSAPTCPGAQAPWMPESCSRRARPTSPSN